MFICFVVEMRMLAGLLGLGIRVIFRMALTPSSKTLPSFSMFTCTQLPYLKLCCCSFSLSNSVSKILRCVWLTALRGRERWSQTPSHAPRGHALYCSRCCVFRFWLLHVKHIHWTGLNKTRERIGQAHFPMRGKSASCDGNVLIPLRIKRAWLRLDCYGLEFARFSLSHFVESVEMKREKAALSSQGVPALLQPSVTFALPESLQPPLAPLLLSRSCAPLPPSPPDSPPYIRGRERHVTVCMTAAAAAGPAEARYIFCRIRNVVQAAPSRRISELSPTLPGPQAITINPRL